MDHFGNFAMLELSSADSAKFSTKWQFDLKIVYLMQRKALSLSDVLANKKHLSRKKDSLNIQAPVDLSPDLSLFAYFFATLIFLNKNKQKAMLTHILTSFSTQFNPAS